MKAPYKQLILASIVALVGVLALGRLAWQQLPATKPKPAALPVEVKPEAAAVLEGGFDTVPTQESVDADIRRARDRAAAVISSVPSPALPQNRRADLAAAFEERLAAVIAPDAARDRHARRVRGLSAPAADAAETVFESARDWTSIFALLPMDIQSVEVRPVYERGEYVAEVWTSKGFGEGTTRLTGDNAFPMAGLDPAKHKLDIVEVMLPVDLPLPPDGKSKRRSYLGFQFVWSVERMQWIPWTNKSYSPGGSGSFGIPF